MATVNGYTAERMKEIEDSAIVDGNIVGDNLILSRHDGATIDAGVVKGDPGPTGPAPTNIAYGVLDYAQRTSAQGPITTVTDVTGCSVTVTVAASRRIRISGQGVVYATQANEQGIGKIKEGATSLGIWWLGPLLVAGRDVNRCGSIILSPSAGVHTYKLTLEYGAVTAGNINLNATASNPTFILVEDIGPA